MIKRNEKGQWRGDTPCLRCIMIRSFLIAVAAIALIYVLSPDTFSLIEGQSTLTLTAGFVGGLALLAIGKATLELIGPDRSGD